MILSDIKHYLSKRGQATLADLSVHFSSDPDALRGMLAVWINKGKIRRVLASSSCGSSCNQCDPEATEIYEWIGDKRNLPLRVNPPQRAECHR
ncbi:MAG: sugar metabolism transcriptional regulator [Gammaproteobacteria bacterium]|nr:sugar metabolism transcriptional regulator [Gammaproteobacteria bacterium]